MNPIVYPYNLESETGRDVANGLNTKRVKPDGLYRYRENDLIINLGNSHRPIWDNGVVMVLNHWDAVATAVNKLKSFQVFKERAVSTVDFSTNIEDAKRWIAEGKEVFCRTILNGHSGEGIVIAKTVEQLVAAPLYTKYFNGKNEYRLHFMGGKLIDFAQKKKRNEAEEANDQIRSYSNNWVFCRDGVSLPRIVVEEARKAIKALNLDFGAIDIRYKVRDNICAVLEVNTSPALVNTTLENYLNGLNLILNGQELTDINYGNFQAQAAPVRPVAPAPAPVAAPAPVVENGIEDLLYHFPSIKSLKVIKSGNNHILKFMVNGIENKIVI